MAEKSNKQRKILYSEPKSYFPESLRKKYKLGEYAEDDKKPAKKKTAKK